MLNSKIYTTFEPGIDVLKQDKILWAVLIFLSVLRLFITKDYDISAVYAPHDNSLYVDRAYWLLQKGYFGSYDSKILVKAPAYSFLLAVLAFFRVSLVLFLDLLLIFTTFYISIKMKKYNVPNFIVLLTILFILFNPVTFPLEHLSVWYTTLREPPEILATLVCVFSAYDIALRRARVLDYIVFLVSSIFIALAREEGILIVVFLFVLVLHQFHSAFREARNMALHSIIGFFWHSRGILKASKIFGVLFIFLVCVYGGFVKIAYGKFIINDMQYGNFPELIARLRQISGPSDHPYVSITQNGLRKAAEISTEMAEIIKYMPALPDEKSPFFARYGVLGEWTNSHMFFWIKDGASSAGLARRLVVGQDNFKKISDTIASYCLNAQSCAAYSPGLFPEWRASWMKATLRGIGSSLRFIFLDFRNLDTVLSPEKFYFVNYTSSIINNPGVDPDILYNVGLRYQRVVGFYFNSLLQNNISEFSEDNEAALSYWRRYRDVFESEEFGWRGALNQDGLREFSNGITFDYFFSMDAPKMLRYLNDDFIARPYSHFLNYGEKEGRSWRSLTAKKSFPTHIIVMRNSLAWIAEISGWFLIFTSIIYFLKRGIRMTIFDWSIFNSVAIFILAKILILGYISTFMGELDQRLFLSLNLLLPVWLIFSFARGMPFLEQSNKVG